MPVQTYRDPRCTRILSGEPPGRGFPSDLVAVTRRRLRALDRAAQLAELRNPPGNGLEKLKGDRAGQHSVRVNDQFRICFRWTNDGPADVEFVDYH